MKVDILSIDAEGYSVIRFDIVVNGETRTFEQNIILPVNNDAKRRKILKQYVSDYKKGLLGIPSESEPIAEDVTSSPTLATRIKEAGQAIKRIF